MHIQIIGQHFAPEEVSGAVLATELSSDLVKRGHRVSYVTSAPSYPFGKVFPGYRNSLFSQELIKGVRVIRTWSFISTSKAFWSRILNFGTFSTWALFGGVIAGKPDVIFSYSPPLPLGISAWVLSRLWRVPWILRVEDLFPDAAIAAGIIRNKFAIWFFYQVERFLYGKAQHISVISEGFRKILISKNVPACKLSVEPVWADAENVQVLPKYNSFRAKHGLSNKFVILYAGNLGQTSSLEDVLHAAKSLKDYRDITFVIVGEGNRKQALQQYASQESLGNVLFLPFQSRDMFPKMLAAADVGVVTLNQESSRFSLPSKVFNIMASGRPILAIAPDDSEIANLIHDAGCGINVPPGKIEAITNVILTFMRNKERSRDMGLSGRLAVEEHYSRQKCINQYEAMIRAMGK